VLNEKVHVLVLVNYYLPSIYDLKTEGKIMKFYVTLFDKARGLDYVSDILCRFQLISLCGSDYKFPLLPFYQMKPNYHLLG